LFRNTKNVSDVERIKENIVTKSDNEYIKNKPKSHGRTGVGNIEIADHDCINVNGFKNSIINKEHKMNVSKRLNSTYTNSKSAKGVKKYNKLPNKNNVSFSEYMMNAAKSYGHDF
jgi:hypothetical protein